MTKFFKNKGKKVTQPEPRDMETLMKEYQVLLSQAAQSQYQVYVYTQGLEHLNQQLIRVNQEADARRKLDAAAQAKLPLQAQTAPEQLTLDVEGAQ